MLINGIKITADFDCDDAELKNYVEYVTERVPNVKRIQVTLDGDSVNVNYVAENEPFERIRRITG